KFQYIKWPPQSPDLSPIELVWIMLKMRLKALRPRAATEEISKVMQQLYSELTDEDRTKVLDTFKDKLRTVIKSGGHTILGWKPKKKPRTSGDSESLSDGSDNEIQMSV
ncbi:hypothetical protein HDV02_001844, partial [Globomyces sp. JEL0801]